MESKRRIDFVKKEFPAMSAHFAHTLEDMGEKFLKIQFIEIKDLVGTISPEDLMLLKASRANVIVYNEVKYEYSKLENGLLYYISTTSDDGKIAMDELIINAETGEYSYQKLANEIEEAPADGEVYARKDKEWVKLSKESLSYSFISGALNKEEITLADLDSFDKSSNPKNNRIERKYELKEDSYIWFVSLKEIDYIAHAGGLEIDYEEKPTIEAKYSGQKETWYCYRTTYQLLSGTWNLIIKFKK